MTPSGERRRLLDNLGLLGSVRPARVPLPPTLIYRYRYEFVALAAAAAAVLAIERAPALAITGLSLLTLTLTLPIMRAHLSRRFWCVLTEHRLRTGLAQARVQTPIGRTPGLIRSRPTTIGETVTVWCFAGTSFEDVAGARTLLRAACWARDVQVRRHPRYSHLVYVDVIRRAPVSTQPAPAGDRLARPLSADGATRALPVTSPLEITVHDHRGGTS